MKYVKKFEKFISEATITASPDPATMPNPTISPPITEPKKPVEPGKEKIKRPIKDPKPKAVTEMDVAKRFIDEVNAKGESVKKYLNK
jgi:hypothetical protein